MKLCIDCKHFRPKHAVMFDDREMGWSPDWCDVKVGEINPVTGWQGRAGDPDIARKSEDLCGPSGRWFVAANIDGKLAELYEKTETGESNGSTSVRDSAR